MKVLILSCNTGSGHNACAAAIQDELSLRRVPSDIRDALAFVSKEVSKFISQGHVWLYRNMPKLYGEGYSYAEKHPGTMDEASAAYHLLSIGVRRLRACLVSQGYTHAVCTHLFPAMMLTQLQRSDPMPLVTAFIATDYTASPGYESISSDWRFIPDASLFGEFHREDLPDGRLVATGIPVRRHFFPLEDKAAAKQLIGVDPAHRHLLVMSGSMGCGPLKQVLERLVPGLPDDTDVSVICGTNQKLSRRLNRLFGENPRVHIHDYVDDVALFMDSADLYLTKPGGVSVSEAIVKKLPMLLMPAVEGCESHNLDFCVGAGMAVSRERPEALAEACLRLLRDEPALAAMRQKLSAARRDSAAHICRLLMQENGVPEGGGA